MVIYVQSKTRAFPTSRQPHRTAWSWLG